MLFLCLLTYRGGFTNLTSWLSVFKDKITTIAGPQMTALVFINMLVSLLRVCKLPVVNDRIRCFNFIHDGNEYKRCAGLATVNS